MPYILLIFEFLTICGYLSIFHFLFKELKKFLSHNSYQDVKYRTATYLALISILQAARFFYYGVIGLTYALMPVGSRLITCEDLIPSYITEVCFSLFVIYHVFVEGKTKEESDRRQDVKRNASAVTTVLDSSIVQKSESRLMKRRIPVYIVQDQDFISKDAGFIDPNELTKSMSTPIFRYAAEDDRKNVLLAYKGKDGQLYTIGPQISHSSGSGPSMHTSAESTKAVQEGILGASQNYRLLASYATANSD